MNYDDKYKYYLNIFNNELELYLKKISETAYENLFLAMQYSLLAGGKRVRPVLMLSTAEEVGLEIKTILPFCIAIEMIHTYSLIHDDLPCMDNDDFRRGKPTNHKVFGEGNAVLAGDALLNYAYEICFNQCENGTEWINASKLLASYAGINGMISGQAADLHAETLNNSDKELLNFIHINKTTKLIQASLLVPLIFKGEMYKVDLTDFSEKLGLLFQYTDDILDVTGNSKILGKSTGKDIDSNKLTIVKLYGLEKARYITEELYQDCLIILNKYSDKFSFLKRFLYNLKTRNH
jgi:geranylgeranyl diphosphate synthase type II